MRTETEIQTEITALREIKPRVRRFSKFNDDHHQTIDLQVEVLEKNLSRNDIADWDSERYDIASDAIDWKEGLREDDEGLAKEWESLTTS